MDDNEKKREILTAAKACKLAEVEAWQSEAAHKRKLVDLVKEAGIEPDGDGVIRFHHEGTIIIIQESVKIYIPDEN